MHEPPLDDVEKMALSGELTAIHDLCYRYKYGLDARQDFALAMHWCTLGARRGADSSQVLVAEMYYEGQGVEKDPAQALRWYLAAAAQGHPHALFMLYVIYAKGVGVEADRELANTYLRTSAGLGYKLAVDELARSATKTETR